MKCNWTSFLWLASKNATRILYLRLAMMLQFLCVVSCEDYTPSGLDGFFSQLLWPFINEKQIGQRKFIPITCIYLFHNNIAIWRWQTDNVSVVVYSLGIVFWHDKHSMLTRQSRSTNMQGYEIIRASLVC